MVHKIGDKTWFRGDELTITTEPYELYGGVFQDGITASGKTVTVATPVQRDLNAKAKRDEWKSQQQQFAKLAKGGQQS